VATWIVHLRLAENLLSMIEGLDSSQFAVGNVAPDSGIPDETWETFNPPVEVTHFEVSVDGIFRMADLDFYRLYMAPLKHENHNRMCFSFRLGYFFHLVTDNSWAEQISRPTRERFAQDFEADPDFGWEVKRDWYGIDLHYVRTHPESIFWRVFLGSEYTQEYLDFMPIEAVQLRLEYIKKLYQRTDEEIERKYGQRPCKYLSEDEVDDFIRANTERLHGIYRHLWEEEGDTADRSSALELF
jgi:hypothetical protein